MALLHSFWQAALLWLLFLILDKIVFRKNSPLEKRNFLFVALATQLAAFFLSFIFYFFYQQQNIDEGILGAVAGRLLPVENSYLITQLLFNTYLLVISYKIIKAIYTWYAFKKQYKQGLIKPGIDLKIFTQSKAYHFGIKRKVKLWLSSTINTPVTFGFFKPVILLPLALMNNISMQQAETLILHELTHIKTNDYLLNWFLLIAETLFFFNPFVKLFCKKIRLEREKHCDISVLAFKYTPILYAETLLKAEHIKRLIPDFQLAAAHNKSQLLHRIHFFSGNKNFSKQRSTSLIGPMISLILLLLFFSAVLFNTQRGTTTASLNNDNVLNTPLTATFENNNLVYANSIFPGINSSDIEKIVANVEQEKPLIEKHLKEIQPLTWSIQNKAEQIAKEAEMDLAIPVTIKENDGERQIIIKEESSGSKKSSVKVYRLIFENNHWIIVPEWMATANEIITDSSAMKKDSTMKRVLTSQ